jgi:ribosome modulation factor
MKRASVKAWCDENEPPAKWKGISSAFRAGARARAAGKTRDDCRYGRSDLAQAWQEGFAGMDAFLSDGGILVCDHCGQELKGTPEGTDR